MTVEGIGYGIALYFLIGVIALGILELATHRITDKIRKGGVVTETQSRLIESGNFVNTKTAILLIIVSLLIFWPVAVYGAITPNRKKKEGDDGSQEQGED